MSILFMMMVKEMKRVWTLKPTGNKKFIATTNDIIGESPMIANEILL